MEVYAESVREAMAVWQDVRGECASWGEFRSHHTRTVKWFVESSLREAMSRKLGASWYARSDGRRGYRNGSYLRTLVTPYGSVQIEVPRLREGSYEHKLWDKKGLLTREARDLILETYLAGASTRRVGEVLEQVFDYKVSAATVSSICKGLDKLVRGYWRRRIDDEWEYLLLDGIVFKNRSAVGTEKRVVLVAMGATTSGRREILSFHQCESESQACWSSFLEDLLRRGFEGKKLRAITTDGTMLLASAAGCTSSGMSRRS
jgi:putative transposase